ncbi:MAG: AAA family ATPase [Candidatus Melainabacteria bacterium]|nr:AAA family ATPase [Candidatus Melainabacteria bacterium]
MISTQPGPLQPNIQPNSSSFANYRTAHPTPGNQPPVSSLALDSVDFATTRTAAALGPKSRFDHFRFGKETLPENPTSASAYKPVRSSHVATDAERIEPLGETGNELFKQANHIAQQLERSRLTTADLMLALLESSTRELAVLKQQPNAPTPYLDALLFNKPPQPPAHRQLSPEGQLLLQQELTAASSKILANTQHQYTKPPKAPRGFFGQIGHAIGTVLNVSFGLITWPVRALVNVFRQQPTPLIPGQKAETKERPLDMELRKFLDRTQPHSLPSLFEQLMKDNAQEPDILAAQTLLLWTQTKVRQTLATGDSSHLRMISQSVGFLPHHNGPLTREMLSQFQERIDYLYEHDYIAASQYKEYQNDLSSLELSTEQRGLAAALNARESTDVQKKLFTVCNLLPWDREAQFAQLPTAQELRQELDSEIVGLSRVKDAFVNSVLGELTINQARMNANLPKIQGKPLIICLNGAPGIGKTAFAKSLAKALHRPFELIPMSQQVDAFGLTGHPPPYVSPKPGAIASALIRAGVNNPVLCFDELEKASSSERNGDPLQVMLEVLDRERNGEFEDKVLSKIDLSNAIIICTTNDIDRLKGSKYEALLSRLSRIDLPDLTNEEKLAIAEQALIPRAREEFGLGKAEVNHIIRDTNAKQGTRYPVFNEATDDPYQEPFHIQRPVLQEIIRFLNEKGGVRQLNMVINAMANDVGRQLFSPNGLNENHDFRSLQEVLQRIPMLESIRQEENAGKIGFIR